MQIEALASILTIIDGEFKMMGGSSGVFYDARDMGCTRSLCYNHKPYGCDSCEIQRGKQKQSIVFVNGNIACNFCVMNKFNL